MYISKKSSLGLVLGSVALVTSGYLAYRRYKDFRETIDEMNCIPWDVPSEHTSWKRFFTKEPIKSTVNTN